MAEWRLEGLSKRFGGTQAVSGLDLTVSDGELLVLLGPDRRRQDHDPAAGGGAGAAG